MAKPDGSAEPLILLESKEEFQQEHGEVLDLENHMDKSVTTYRDNQDRPKHIKKRSPFDFNMFATRKTMAEGMLDLALLLANSSQLKHLLMTDGKHKFFNLMLYLLVSSICLQILIGLALVYLTQIQISTKIDQSIQEKARIKKAVFLNNVIVAGIFLLAVVNVIISSFGMNDPNDSVVVTKKHN